MLGGEWEYFKRAPLSGVCNDLSGGLVTEETTGGRKDGGDELFIEVKDNSLEGDVCSLVSNCFKDPRLGSTVTLLKSLVFEVVISLSTGMLSEEEIGVCLIRGNVRWEVGIASRLAYILLLAEVGLGGWYVTQKIE